MTETRLQAVRRRWRNITNAIRGVNAYVDEHGTRYADYALTEDEVEIILRWAVTEESEHGLSEAGEALVNRLEGAP